MKRIAFFFASLAVVFSFVSCNKEAVPEEVQPVKQTIKFDITVGNLVPETRAAKTGWVDGDKINIWFDDSINPIPDLVITYNGSSWDAALREDCQLTKSQGKLTAMYEDGNNLSELKSSSVSTNPPRIRFSFPTEGSQGVYSRLVACTSNPQDYTFADGLLQASIEEWDIVIGLQFTVTGLSPQKKYSLDIKDNKIPGVESNIYVPESISIIANGNTSIGVHGGPYVAESSSEGEAVFHFAHGNSIFLPAAGDRQETSLIDPGRYGNYWSTSVGRQISYGWSVSFSSGSIVPGMDAARQFGQSIRPVTDYNNF